MARNTASSYGVDVACVRDADALFTSVTGIDVVKQDAIHRLTTDDVLGPGGDGWGYDTRRLLGLPQSRLAGLQPVLSEVLQRDERVLTADVTLTATRTSSGLADVAIKATCTTAEGSFDLVTSVLELTSALIEGQGA